MTTTRFARWQKATALAPVAALSAACTVAIAGVGGPVGTLSAAGDTVEEGAIVVPDSAVEAPASVSLPDAVAPAVPEGQSGAVISAASTSGIPAVALGAYQRAQTIINGADNTCNISWQLVAAIGRVESDHGRFGGSQLDDAGIASPGIYGLPLDGTNGTQRIADTDAGELDNDASFDRAVGPMQFIPSTWRVVGVDADRDGVRDPQNIHDAALATAVYLCSGTEDLSAEDGKRAAVFRYNRSDDYVNLVLAIEQAYLDGEFTSVPNAVAAADYFVPAPVAPGTNTDTTDNASPTRPGTTPGTGGSGSTPGTGSGGSGGGSTGGGSGSGGGSTDPGTGSGGGGGTPSVPAPVPTPTPTPTPSPTPQPITDIPGTIEDPVGTIVYTLETAKTECLKDLNLLGILAGLLTPGQQNLLNRCVNGLVGTPVP